MSGTVQSSTVELVEKARREHERLEEKLWKSFAFRAYLARRGSGLSVSAHRALAKNQDFARWHALDRLLVQLERHMRNRILH